MLKDTIHNERTRLLAAAVDRFSTSCLTVGLATPVAGRLFGITPGLPMSLYGATCGTFLGLAVMFHLVARSLLGGLR